MAKISRDRGVSYEREVANIFKARGYDAYRTAQHMGKTGKAPDVVAPGLHIECKRRRAVAVYEWYEQAEADAQAEGQGNIPVVFLRADGKKSLALVEAESDFMRFYSEYMSGKELTDGNIKE